MQGESEIRKIIFLVNNWTEFNKNICCRHHLDKLKEIFSNFRDYKKVLKNFQTFYEFCFIGDSFKVSLLYFHENISRLSTLTYIFSKSIEKVVKQSYTIFHAMPHRLGDHDAWRRRLSVYLYRVLFLI